MFTPIRCTSKSSDTAYVSVDRIRLERAKNGIRSLDEFKLLIEDLRVCFPYGTALVQQTWSNNAQVAGNGPGPTGDHSHLEDKILASEAALWLMSWQTGLLLVVYLHSLSKLRPDVVFTPARHVGAPNAYILHSNNCTMYMWHGQCAQRADCHVIRSRLWINYLLSIWLRKQIS